MKWSMFDFSADLQKYAGFWCRQDIKDDKHRDFFSLKESQSNWWGFLSCSLWVCCRYVCAARTDTAEWVFNIRSGMWLSLGRCRCQPSTVVFEKVEVKCNYLCPEQLIPRGSYFLGRFLLWKFPVLYPFFHTSYWMPFTECSVFPALWAIHGLRKYDWNMWESVNKRTVVC